jgi:hypothetical protein
MVWLKSCVLCPHMYFSMRVNACFSIISLHAVY